MASKDAETAAVAERLQSSGWGYRHVERMFDEAFSVLVLVCLSWFFLLTTVVIKLGDPYEPSIFVRACVGRDGREFHVYKLRSMMTDVEARLVQLFELNEKSNPVFKLNDDPRVTGVERVLHKVSINELPQFVNVLKGGLSVAGPRLNLYREMAKCKYRQWQRLLVNQVLTCFWQTGHDRDSITFDKWTDLKLPYIKSCSLWADLKLIV